MILMKNYPYVYQLCHKTTNEFYIGFRYRNSVSAEQDLGIKYFTSSKLIKPRFFEFNFMVLAEFFHAEDTYDFEQQLIHENWGEPGLMNGYCRYGVLPRFSTTGHVMAEDTKAKISAKHLGKKLTSDHKAKLLAANVGRVHSEESKVKRRGRKLTNDHKVKLLEANKGRTMSSEARAKMSSVKSGANGKTWIHHHLFGVRSCTKEDLPLYLNQGWIKGKKNPTNVLINS